MMTNDGVLPTVTVSIVIHHQWDLVQPLLEQLQRYCAVAIDRVILTVNVPEPALSTDAWHIPVTVIHNETPLGFGANHNRAFQHCRAPWFLVLNPDIRLDADVLSEMLALAQPTAGLLAPRIQEPGRPQPEPYRDLLTPVELLRKRSKHHQPPSQPAWVAGMFMLLRSNAYRQVEGFDKRFFMYCEDFDLCARLRLAGWTLQITDSICVLHDAQRASNSSVKPLLWHLGSLARLWTSRAFWRYAALLRHVEASPASR